MARGRNETSEATAGIPAPAARRDASEAGAVLSAAAQLIGGDDANLAGFFTGFTRYAIAEDIVRFSGAELAAIVRYVYRKAAGREPGTTIIETFDLSEAGFARSDVLLVAVNDDMPFLYDSCTAEVLAQGFTIRAAIHPITLRLQPGSEDSLRESTILLALGKIADKDKLAGLRRGVAKVFGDVRTAVRDWKPMVTALHETIDELKRKPPDVSHGEFDEVIAFLEWLADDHFTFLGVRDYVFDGTGEGKHEPVLSSGLGLLSDPEMRVIRRGAARASLTPEVRAFLTQPSPLIIAKSNERSSVHRRVHMDYIGVKRFDATGALLGERRFVGLFTSAAYSQYPPAIPLLRQKVANVLAGSGLPADSHDGKALAHVLNSYPRDELFQISEEELLNTALGILALVQRPKVRVFLRFDRFDRFVSAIVYVPRERYNTSVREKIHAILARAFDGRPSSARPSLDHESLARVHFIIGRNEGPRPHVDIGELEAEIRAAIRTWGDGFIEALTRRFGESEGVVVNERYEDAFPAAYCSTFPPTEAVEDIRYIDALLAGNAPGGDVFVHVYQRETDFSERDRRYLRMKLFAANDYVSLSDCLPVFENLGLRVIAEESFVLTPRDEAGAESRIAAMNFYMERQGYETGADFAEVKNRLEDGFHAVWRGYAESDGFNRLIVETELDWRDVTILRTVAKFLRQAGITFSQAYMEAALAKNPELARQLVDLFYALHDPEAFDEPRSRAEDVTAIRERINAGLENVPNADEDRIVRAFAGVIDAILRTNFFQAASGGGTRDALALKLDSARLDILPAPRPYVEIYVYAPSVEGVHLRFGPIARGGIRWSDRAEDFRTEVLGLVKAQQVKNAVIVPVGAKGGFYPKRLPKGGTREEIQASAIAAYKIFISALLDLTDNVGPEGDIVPPARTIRRDGDDPYLVVAADKGTASFSDIANAIATARGFWLGDAFASGGSHGYDHKEMGITARGTWEAIKRHFREKDHDIQRTPFTCIGVGDMSGDVFGNGMLLSKKTKLIAAFDHRHIFFDPDPDPAASWRERKRLFGLQRSSWDDYDRSLISEGGGVVPRSAKKIVLSPQMKALTGLKSDEASPQQVIKALLTAETDLLYFGGIGTFVKASHQSQAEVGDRANDAMRVDASDIRAAVIGEGANLAITQLGRIEYARHGGRINLDAIDNSAGVDTSDHEVNLKILLNAPLRRGEISEEERDALLAEMTEDVARHVLKNNYDQTEAISVAEELAPRDIEAAARFVRDLERAGRLDRAVEYLPSEEELRARAKAGEGLSRPEIAVLLSYSKLDLLEDVTRAALPDEPFFRPVLEEYFPPAAVARFSGELEHHRLKREIVATQLVNTAVNLAGPLFAYRMREMTSTPHWQAIEAFAIADAAFGLVDLKARIEALDRKVPSSAQYRMLARIGDFLRRSALWFIVHRQDGVALAEIVAAHGATADILRKELSRLATEIEMRLAEETAETFVAAGVPADIAHDIAVLAVLDGAPDITLLSRLSGAGIAAAGACFSAIGEILGLDLLRTRIDGVVTGEHWDRLALRRAADDLYSAQRVLAREALAHAVLPKNPGPKDGKDAAREWSARHAVEVGRMRDFLSELERSGELTLSKVSLASSRIQKLARASWQK